MQLAPLLSRAGVALVAAALTTSALAEGPAKKPPFADPPAGAPAGEAGEKKGPPFADASKAPTVEPRPEHRMWNVVQESEAGKVAFSFDMKPGVPDPGQVVEVIVHVNAIPKRPDPVFGSTVPFEGARLILEVTNPAGQLVGRTVAHPIPQAKGRYGVHFTATQDGIYGLTLKGKSAKGDPLSASVKLPVNTWPLPDDLKGTGDKLNELGGRKGPISGQ